MKSPRLASLFCVAATSLHCGIQVAPPPDGVGDVEHV